MEEWIIQSMGEWGMIGIFLLMAAENVFPPIPSEIVLTCAGFLTTCSKLTKPQAIKDFYENDELIAITKELADTLRKNKTIDWQKRESARAKMRMLIKKLLKKHKYPPEGMEDAVQTVMTQCELWTDNVMDA